MQVTSDVEKLGSRWRGFGSTAARWGWLLPFWLEVGGDPVATVPRISDGGSGALASAGHGKELAHASAALARLGWPSEGKEEGRGERAGLITGPAGEEGREGPVGWNGPATGQAKN